MTIPDEAVEAAATAIHRYDVREGLASSYAPNEHHRAEARAALEAAAPHLKAQALREAADIAGRPENSWWAEGQHRAMWLRELAAVRESGQ